MPLLGWRSLLLFCRAVFLVSFLFPEHWFLRHRSINTFQSIRKCWAVIPFSCGTSLLALLDVSDEFFLEVILEEFVELLASPTFVALKVDRILFFVEVPLRF